MLTHLDTKKTYKSLRNEGSIKLITESLPIGDYELLIYAYNCLGNMPTSKMLESIDVEY